MELDLANSHSSYVEFVVLNNSNVTNAKSNTFCILDVNHPIEQFTQMLKRIGKRYHKVFEKSFKCYLYKDLILENYEQNEIKVYKKKFKNHVVNGSYVTIYYDKHKVPFHVFPSTTQINGVYYCKRLTFRICNRIYINFETQYHSNVDKYVYKIFVNYNHEPNVDIDNIKMMLQTILDVLVVPTC